MLLVLIMTAALIKSFVIDPGNGRIPAGEIKQLNDQWEKVMQTDGIGQYSEYEYVIPENSGGNLVFSMENSWTSVNLFLDGREFYFYEDTYKELGAKKLWIELPENSSGKIFTMRIIGRNSSAERVMKSPMYLGEKDAVFLAVLKDNFYALLFFICTLILAFIIWICKMSLKEKLSRSNLEKIRYLGLFIVDAGIWVLTDSQIMQFFTGKTAIIEVVSFLTFLMMPLIMILFIKEMMAYPWKIYDILFRIGLVNTSIILSMYLFRILPIYGLLFLQHLLILFTIPIILRNSIKEIKKYKNQSLKKVVMGFGILSICAVAALGAFYVNFSINYVYFYSVGFLLFMVCLAWSVLEEVCYHLEITAKTEIYRKMAYRDGMTGMENRAAFEKVLEQETCTEGLTYIVFDNNNLKKINDTYGHQVGDQLLIETAECIREIFERLGRCFRIGGDEFFVILKGMSEDEVKVSLEYFEHRLAETNKKREIPIEIAYGYFTCQDASMSLGELFKKADANMYLEKEKMKSENKNL